MAPRVPQRSPAGARNPAQVAQPLAALPVPALVTQRGLLQGSPWPRPAAAQGAAWLAAPPPRALVLALPKELLDEERRGDRGAAGGPAAPAPPAEDAAARDEEARLFQALVALRKARPARPGSGVRGLHGAARCARAPAHAAQALLGHALLLPALPQGQAPGVG